MNRSVAIPGAAVLLCALGIVGLFLPLADVRVGIGSVRDNLLVRAVLNLLDSSAFQVPVLGVLLLVAFVGGAVVAGLDLVAGRVRFTKQLAVAAAIGFLPIVAFTVAVTWFGSWLANWVGADFAAVGVGLGAVLLLVADLGLLGVGAAVLRAPPPPSPPSPSSPSSPRPPPARDRPDPHL